MTYKGEDEKKTEKQKCRIMLIMGAYLVSVGVPAQI